MHTFNRISALMIGFISTAFFSEAAVADGRAYVSRTGSDDASCGPYTLPCKSINYAYATLAAQNSLSLNKIICIDPVSAGALTITIAVMIDCTGQEAFFTSLTINAGANDVVTLRGVHVGFSSTNSNAYATAAFGIAFNSGAALTIEDSTIRDVTYSLGIGVDFKPSAASTLTIVNSSILNNGSVSGGGGGLRVQPTSSGSARVVLKNVTFANNYVGLAAIGSGNNASIDVVDSIISNNSAFAAYAAGTGASVTLSNSSITNNGGAATTGSVFSYGNNRIVRNNPDTSPSNAGTFR